MPSPQTSRETLEAYRRRAGLRTPEESWDLKQGTILRWACSPQETRVHKTQREFAAAIRHKSVVHSEGGPFDVPWGRCSPHD